MGFPAALGGIIGGAGDFMGSIISSAVGAKMTEETNQTQKNIAQDQQVFEKGQADTVHQREVADLRAAGLNPILSAKLGGNPVASYQAPIMQNPGDKVRLDFGGSKMVEAWNASALNREQVKTQSAVSEKARVDADVAKETKAAQIAAEKAKATKEAVSSAKSITEMAFNESWLGKKSIQWNRLLRNIFGKEIK